MIWACGEPADLPSSEEGNVSSLFGRDGVVRGNDLPSAVNHHPHIRQPVMVFIRLATGSPFLVVRACHDRHITMHAHLKVGHLGNQYGSPQCAI